MSEVKKTNQQLIEELKELHRQLDPFKELQNRLQVNSSFVQRCLDLVEVMLVVIDAEQKTVFINKRGCEILGYTEEEIIGKKWFDHFLPGRVRAEVKAIFDQLMAGQQEAVEFYETPVLTKNGQEKMIAWHNTVLTSDNGHIRGTLSSGLDISLYKQAEEALRQSESRLQTVVDNTVDAIITIDSTGLIRSFNPAAERIFGYRSAGVIGRNIKMLMPEPYQSEHDSYLKNYLRTGQAKIMGIGREAIGLRKDGTTFPIDLAVSEFRLGEQRMFTGIVRDLSEHKRAEEDRQHLQEQLYQAQKMEAIGRLAGGVAHDFNNLMTSIMLNTDLLLDEVAADDSMRTELEEIAKAAERATALTRQLLAFSRRQVTQPEVLDLNEVVGNMEKMLCRIIGEDIELDTVPGLALGRVKVDPGELEQVLMNLVVNARDAMPQGGKLTIETSNVVLDEEYARLHVNVQPGAYVMLAVTDTGCGMDAEILSHIFEPFFTTKERGKGTGLGLSTVYGIVEQNHGHIQVHSTVGRGTRFEIFLPRVDVKEGSDLPHYDVSPSPQGTETIP